MFNFLPLVGNQSRIERSGMEIREIIFSMPWLRLSCLVTSDTHKYGFLLHSSEENDDMSVLVAVIHFRVGFGTTRLKGSWIHDALGPACQCPF
jgi:hypothetical protein